ncbi:MAG: hypothetical protein RLZZ461_610 [Planctomycetota bacterium]|jgi:type 2 lantibiotic biosynthesis protein LanM
MSASPPSSSASDGLDPASTEPGLDWSIVEGALTLPERIALLRRVPQAFTADPDRADVVRRRWRDVLGRAEDASLDDRLADLGLDDADLPRAVGRIDPSAASEVEPAAWMTICAAVGREVPTFGADGLPVADFLGPDPDAASETGVARRHADGPSDSPEPIPFEDGLVPWVEVATRRLRERVPALDRLLAPGLLRREQRRLLENLAVVSRFANIADLESHRLGMYSGNDLALGLLIADPPRTAYRRTVEGMIGVRSRDWMRRRPALARLLGVRVVGWIRGLAEFLDRLERDRPALEATFADGASLGPLTELSFASGDSHNGGRSVGLCTFDSGVRLAYKPRSCRVDVAFAEIVDDLNALLDPALRLRTPRTLDRGDHGWAEFIESRPCDDREAMLRFHRRIGVLLALIHTLQGNDFHFENVKACGEHPVPVDLETVCVPDLQPGPAAETSDPTMSLIARSVLRTLLLPSVAGRGGANVLRNLGAVHVEVGEGVVRRVRRLTRINTDFQRWILATPQPDTHRSDATPWTEADDQVDADVQQRENAFGYRVAYEAILARRDAWLAADSPIRRLDEAFVRVLNRSTNVYARLLQESCGSSDLESGVARWLTIERLALSLGVDRDPDERATDAALIQAESASLRDGDVAYFLAPAAGRSIWIVDPDSGGPVECAGTRLRASAVESAMTQVAAMSPDDLTLQLRLQGSAYRATIISLSRRFHATAGDSAPEAPTGDASTATRSLRRTLVATLDDLAAQAIVSGDGVNWIDFILDTRFERVRPSALDAGLYGGRGGLALLFEKAYRVLGDGRWLDLARRSLAGEFGAWRDLPTSRAWMTRLVPAGMLDRGGLVAGLWAIGRHEGGGDHRTAAIEIATTISNRTICADEDFDVIGGAAGFILLLLRLHEESTIPGAADVIGRLADHLVSRVVDLDGPGWRTIGQRLPLCGFAHGRAGIALALLQAGRMLDRADLRRVAMAVFEAEHRLRGDNPSAGWPDLRGLEPPDRMRAPMGSSQWCSGTEGIALSRAAALQVEDHPVLRDDLAFALESVRPLRKPGRGHICCGSTGRIMTHQTLRRLGCGEGLDAGDGDDAARMVGAVLARHHAGDDGGALGVGLFQGLAGIVWTGLSLLDDDGSDLLLLRP